MFDDDDDDDDAGETTNAITVAVKPPDEVEAHGSGSHEEARTLDFVSCDARPIVLTVPIHRLRTSESELVMRVHDVSLTATIRLDVRRKE